MLYVRPRLGITTGILTVLACRGFVALRATRGEAGESRGAADESQGAAGESRVAAGESRGAPGESRGAAGESRGAPGESPRPPADIGGAIWHPTLPVTGLLALLLILGFSPDHLGPRALSVSSQLLVT